MRAGTQMLFRFVAIAILCGSLGAQQPAIVRVQSERVSAQLSTFARGLEFPWSLAFLPDGRLLVTERPGRMRLVASDGALSAPLSGVPTVFARGQGGLLDVVVDPNFGVSRTIFFCFAELGDGGAGTAVARAHLGATTLTEVQVIFRQSPKRTGNLHFGCRIVLAPDQTLFVALGERNERDRSQDLGAHLGKLVRINRDGSVPKDNPFASGATARPEIWSYGHRNMQGAALHPSSGRVWTHEHGARGGDEINIPEPGKNYGWPVITHGIDYSGAPIGEGRAKTGMEQPIYTWIPSIAPSGMAFYSRSAGSAFPMWRGNLFVGALAGRALVRLELDGDRVVHEERLLQDLDERIRDVRVAPDGTIYLLTDQVAGRILRLLPDK